MWKSKADLNVMVPTGKPIESYAGRLSTFPRVELVPDRESSSVVNVCVD